jgi:hypothetical protein
MFRTCRVLNKFTGEIFEGQIDTLLEGLLEYELVKIPDDGKEYIWDAENSQVIEKIPTLEESKQALLETIKTLKQTPFPVDITDVNEVEGSYYLNLDDSIILKILVLLKKAEIMGQASDEFINTEIGIAEYKTFSLAEIQSVQAEVIQKDDFLKLKANQVKNAETTADLESIEQELSAF